MMISENMASALIQQIANELNTAHSYLAMALAFEEKGLKVFGRRFHAQATEEREHAMKIVKYLQDVGASVILAEVARPKSDYGSAQAMVEAALESERTVTQQINDLVALADSEKDHATFSFLQWFVDEQVEEVATMSELLQLVKLAGEANLFFVEGRLAKTMQSG